MRQVARWPADTAADVEDPAFSGEHDPVRLVARSRRAAGVEMLDSRQDLRGQVLRVVSEPAG